MNIMIIMMMIMIMNKKRKAGFITLYLKNKFTLFIFFENFPKCKPIQIVVGRKIADKILNKVTCGDFDFFPYASIVYIVK